MSRIPAYKTMPPSLISVPRPVTTVVEKPFEVRTRTGMSTGILSQRRVFGESGMVPIINLRHRPVQITKVQQGVVIESTIR